MLNNGLFGFKDQNASRTFHPVHNLTGAPFTNRFHDESHRETFCGCPLDTDVDAVSRSSVELRSVVSR